MLDKDEQERGESIAEFSIGNTRHEWNTVEGRNGEFSTVSDETILQLNSKGYLEETNKRKDKYSFI